MCVCVISTVPLIVPSLTLCSTAITFTARLASDYLSLAHRSTNTEILLDTRICDFNFYFFPLRCHFILKSLVWQSDRERKPNYGTDFHLVTARLCVLLYRTCWVCVVHGTHEPKQQLCLSGLLNLLVPILKNIAHFCHKSLWTHPGWSLWQSLTTALGIHGATAASYDVRSPKAFPVSSIIALNVYASVISNLINVELCTVPSCANPQRALTRFSPLKQGNTSPWAWNSSKYAS